MPGKTKIQTIEPELLTVRADAAIRPSAAEYLTFVAATGDNPTSVEMRYEDGNIWLTQKMMAVLYDVESNTITYHLINTIYGGDLDFRHPVRDGSLGRIDTTPHPHPVGMRLLREAFLRNAMIGIALFPCDGAPLLPREPSLTGCRLKSISHP